MFAMPLTLRRSAPEAAPRPAPSRADPAAAAAAIFADRGAAPPPVLRGPNGALPSGATLGPDLTLFHDDPSGGVAVAAVADGLWLGLDGGGEYVSLSFAPDPAALALTPAHFLRLRARVAGAIGPLWLRLSMRCDGREAQSSREAAPQGDHVEAAFDLQALGYRGAPPEALWADLIMTPGSGRAATVSDFQILRAPLGGF